MKKIITFSREFGAGAGEIGLKVAKALGYEYYDKELILKTAREINMDATAVINLDEKAPVVFGFTQSLFDLYNAPLNEQLYEAQRKVIKEIAERKNCVIVGRNANSILGQYDSSLHVFIHADFSWRVKRLKEEKMQAYTEEKIEARIKQVDKAREKFCSYYTGRNFGNADNYDLSLSSSSLGIDRCIELILKAAE